MGFIQDYFKYTTDDIEHVRLFFNNNPMTIKYSKRDSNLTCSFMRVEGNIYAMSNKMHTGEIGRGLYGRVKYAINIAKPNELLVVKIMNNPDLYYGNSQEQTISYSLGLSVHEKEISRDIAENHHTKKHYMFFRYTGVDLIKGKIISSDRTPSALAFLEKIKIINYLISALKVLHAQFIVHRDIQPANITFQKDLSGNIVGPSFIDFGRATASPSEQDFTIDRISLFKLIYNRTFDEPDIFGELKYTLLNNEEFKRLPIELQSGIEDCYTGNRSSLNDIHKKLSAYYAGMMEKFKVILSEPTIKAYQHIFDVGVNKVSQVNDNNLKLLMGIRALLDDYTKQDCVVKRFFYGHWNRHHIKTVVGVVRNIDIYIAKNQTIDTPYLHSILYALNIEVRSKPGFNSSGSIAKRIKFITGKLNFLTFDHSYSPFESSIPLLPGS